MELMQASSCCSSGRPAVQPATALPSCRPSTKALLVCRRHARQARRQQGALASSMGIGFHPVGSPQPLAADDLVLPGLDYGLSVQQMQVLGLTNDAAKLPEVRAVSARRAGGGGAADVFIVCSWVLCIRDCRGLLAAGAALRVC